MKSQRAAYPRLVDGRFSCSGSRISVDALPGPRIRTGVAGFISAGAETGAPASTGGLDWTLFDLAAGRSSGVSGRLVRNAGRTAGHGRAIQPRRRTRKPVANGASVERAAGDAALSSRAMTSRSPICGFGAYGKALVRRSKGITKPAAAHPRSAGVRAIRRPGGIPAVHRAGPIVVKPAWITIRLNRIHDLNRPCLNMIAGQTHRVCPEGKKPVPTLGIKSQGMPFRILPLWRDARPKG